MPKADFICSRSGLASRFTQKLSENVARTGSAAQSRKPPGFLSISVKSHNDRPRGATVAMFAKKDSLPGSKCQTTVGNGNGKAATQQRRFDMSRHIIRAFASMHERQRLGCDMVHRSFKVPAHIGIGTFVDRQGCRGVLDEEMQKADAYIGQLRNTFDDAVGNQMKTATHGRDRQLCLVPHG